MNCPDCNIPMERRESKFNQNKWWYTCPNFPDCDMQATQDKKSGRWIDYPAGAEIRALRRKAHQLMEDVFGDWGDKRGARASMYAWLRTRVKSGHIGHATKKELERVIKLLERKIWSTYRTHTQRWNSE